MNPAKLCVDAYIPRQHYMNACVFPNAFSITTKTPITPLQKEDFFNSFMEKWLDNIDNIYNIELKKLYILAIFPLFLRPSRLATLYCTTACLSHITRFRVTMYLFPQIIYNTSECLYSICKDQVE